MKIFLIVHFGALAAMSIYGLHRIRLLILWCRECGKSSEKISRRDIHPATVTVQLPIYNERFVAKRLIEAVCSLAWPRDLLDIQVLDDSDDETRFIVDKEVSRFKELDHRITVLRRPRRTGYKAGALKHGLDRTDSEFIAIFDADFVPPRDFLQRAMPHFTDKSVGFIQARWGFLNEADSWFTRTQAVFLSAHFGVEQFVRHRTNLFLNFNGTAGIWRKSAIVSAGGWEDDTVTEDLDLSFRAQLGGWKARYLDDLVVASELPTTLSALRGQQKRWAKGSIQTARKLLPSLWTSGASLAQKIEGTIHLLSNIGWLLGSLIFVTLYPTLTERVGIGPLQILRTDAPLFILGTLAILAYFFCHERFGRGRSITETVKLFLFLPAFGLGLAPSVAMGVLEGLVRSGGLFLRTPKFGARAGRTGTLPNSSLRYHRASLVSLLADAGFLAYSFLPIVLAVDHETYLAVPLLSVFSFGFIMTVYLDLLDLLKYTLPSFSKKTQSNF